LKFRKNLQVPRRSTSPTKHQVSECRKILNSNAMGDMFVAFTMVQQIMTGLSRAASEERKVSAISKAVLIY
jgi:hypothetical protein